jgi:capsular exopolysaccharide synthesis family protein
LTEVRAPTRIQPANPLAKVITVTDETAGPQGAWLHRRGEQEGLGRYLQTLRERLGLIAVCTLAAVAAAVIYVLVASPTYKAQAQILVTPVSRDDDTLTNLGLIRDSNDPTRDVSTAAKLVTAPDVARRVIRQLHLRISVHDLLEKVSSEPIAQSNLVAVTAEAGDPRGAQARADAFAQATVDDRTRALQAELATMIPQLRKRMAGATAAERPELAAQLAELQALATGPDPTVRVQQRAEAPIAPARPRAKLSLAAGLIGGLIVGIAAAFALQAVDPRVRREEQLRALYRIPILARIPRERRRSSAPLPPAALTPASVEGFRTLRATLAAASAPRNGRGRSILVTGASPSEGKSTTAVNLAVSLAHAGHSVILIEADLRRPTLGAAFGVQPRFGVSSVLMGDVRLEQALINTPEYGPNLELLLVDQAGIHMADRLSLPTARKLVAEAEQLADYVIIDSPPLTEVIDALPLAQQAGDVVVVVRLGRGRMNRLEDLGEILTRHGVRPAGLVLVGVERSGGSYYYAGTERSLEASASAS